MDKDIHQASHATVTIDTADIKSSTMYFGDRNDGDDLYPEYDDVDSDRNTVNGGSSVETVSVNSDNIATGTPTSHGGDDQRPGSDDVFDGRENQLASKSDENDNVSDRACRSCCGENWCSRRCRRYWNDKRTTCRNCATGSREFVEEVGELIGQIEFRRRAKRLFSVQTVLDLFPILKWLPKYRLVVWQRTGKK